MPKTLVYARRNTWNLKIIPIKKIFQHFCLEINGTVEVLQKLFRSIQFDILQHFEQIKNQNLKDKLSKVKNTTGLIGPILAVQNSFFRNSFKVFSPSVPYAISISSEAVPPQKNIVKSSPINIPASLQFTKKKFQG